jgi:hypothetical protein
VNFGPDEGQIKDIINNGSNITMAKGGQSTREHLIEAMNIARSFQAES